MLDRRFYVYVHKRISDGRLFYVGKGTGNRLKQSHGRSPLWKSLVNKHGFVAEIAFNELTEYEAFRMEMSLISWIGRDSLVNLSDGGEGNAGKVISDYQKMRISQATKGRKNTKETIARKIESSMWRRKPVMCVDTGTIYSGLVECCRELGLSKSKVSQVCNGARSHHKGLRFRFVTSDSCPAS